MAPMFKKFMIINTHVKLCLGITRSNCDAPADMMDDKARRDALICLSYPGEAVQYFLSPCIKVQLKFRKQC